MKVETILICKSIMHFVRDCPHKNSEVYETSQTDQKEVFKVINFSQDEKQVLMTEAVHAAVLDSACSKTVAGKAWKEMYLATLSHQEKKEVKIFPSKTSFKFGAGDPVSAKECMEIPCVIGGLRTTMKTEVVESDIPLLLSKPDMKRMGFKLNMANDTLEVNGKYIELDTTSSGHYYIPLKECTIHVENVNITEMKSSKEKEKELKKLHRQFGHPSAQSLKAILKNAEVLDKQSENIIDEMNKNCEICKRYKRTPSRPIVSMPMAQQFNDVVAMDLKTYENKYFLHFIDLHTRFSKSKVIRNKNPKTIVDAVATEWIAAGFGPPKKFLVDNGGEFDNEEYRELAEKFNVEICSTAAYSPWSNGICERNHHVVDLCVQKITEEEPDINIEVALAWAVNAKNTMMNHLGYSPIQLVLGQNPNLPSSITNKPPANEEAVSQNIMKHLNVLHAARRAYTKAEASERIKRALRHNIRTSEEQFHQGEKIFYKRDDCNRWRGPGKVIGQDGKILFIRHGSQLVRVATCRAVKVDIMVREKSKGKATPEDEEIKIIRTGKNLQTRNKDIPEDEDIEIISDSSQHEQNEIIEETPLAFQDEENETEIKNEFHTDQNDINDKENKAADENINSEAQ